jgi:hypothetical protein
LFPKYIYIHTYIIHIVSSLSLYIYIYRERERGNDPFQENFRSCKARGTSHGPHLSPTLSLGFGELTKVVEKRAQPQWMEAMCACMWASEAAVTELEGREGG